jgi:hypothetical protein
MGTGPVGRHSPRAAGTVIAATGAAFAVTGAAFAAPGP